MRIEPEHLIAARTRQVENNQKTDGGFASALDAVRDANASAETRPAAERWGQWGPGATAAGYGPAPDPAQFAHHPTGPAEGAHPLNPRGNTTANPAFTVPGYTVRGTPIPPGFYNLAYYNRYLREGGTPLEGFEAYDPEKGSLTDVYGSFGDGRDRATSFLASKETTSGSASAASTVPLDAVRTASAARDTAAMSVTITDPPPEPTAEHADTARARTATAPPPAAANEGPPANDPSTLLADAAHQAVRMALQNLLDDLLRIA